MGIGVRQIDTNHWFITDSVVELCVFRLVCQMASKEFTLKLDFHFQTPSLAAQSILLPCYPIPQKFILQNLLNGLEQQNYI